MTELVRLGSNENLLGPSPLALDAIRNACAEAHLYPTDQDQILKEKLSAAIGHGISPDHIVLGNGSGDVLRMIAQTYVSPGSQVVLPTPTFSSYKRVTKLHGGDVIEVPLKDYQIDLPGLLSAITPETTLIFLCNPNNPTGQIVTHQQTEAFLAQVPDHVTVVVDEAYIDFVDDPAFPRMTELITAGYNVIVARTFSKVYGLASLRVGYGFGKLESIAPVRDRRHSFESGRMAYVGAAAAINDEVHIVNTIDMVRNGREYLYEALSKIGLNYLRSQAFFVLLTDLPLDAQYIVDEALEQGVILRHTTVFDMPGYVRISIGRLEDNRRAIEALTNILQANDLI